MLFVLCVVSALCACHPPWGPATFTKWEKRLLMGTKTHPSLGKLQNFKRIQWSCKDVVRDAQCGWK